MVRRVTWLKVLLFHPTQPELPLGKQMILCSSTKLEMIGMFVIIIFGIFLIIISLHINICYCYFYVFCYFLHSQFLCVRVICCH